MKDRLIMTAQIIGSLLATGLCVFVLITLVMLLRRYFNWLARKWRL